MQIILVLHFLELYDKPLSTADVWNTWCGIKFCKLLKILDPKCLHFVFWIPDIPMYFEVCR